MDKVARKFVKMKFHGLETQGIQLLDPTFKFDYSVLPEV